MIRAQSWSLLSSQLLKYEEQNRRKESRGALATPGLVPAPVETPSIPKDWKVVPTPLSAGLWLQYLRTWFFSVSNLYFPCFNLWSFPDGWRRKPWLSHWPVVSLLITMSNILIGPPFLNSTIWEDGTWRRVEVSNVQYAHCPSTCPRIVHIPCRLHQSCPAYPLQHDSCLSLSHAGSVPQWVGKDTDAPVTWPALES